MNAIGSAFNGLARSTQQLNSAHNRIAQGDLDVKPIVDSKVAELGIKANLKSIDAILETEKAALDILA